MKVEISEHDLIVRVHDGISLSEWTTLLNRSNLNYSVIRYEYYLCHPVWEIIINTDKKGEMIDDRLIFQEVKDNVEE